MKIIDLLNKIANGEEVPKKIKCLNYEYEFHQVDKEYQRWFNGSSYGLGEDRRLDIILDYEVEILEEKKKIPEKLEEPRFNKGRYYIKDINGDDSEISGIERTFRLKINEIIDYLKSKGE